MAAKIAKIHIQRDCALGETLTAEVMVDLESAKGVEAFDKACRLLDARLIFLNYRVADAMKLETKWGPEVAAKVRAVIDVLLGAKSIKQFEEQKDLAPMVAPDPVQPTVLTVIQGGKPSSKLVPAGELL